MDAPNDFQPKPGEANKTKRCTHNSITYTEARQAGAQKSQVKAKGGKRNATRHQKFQNGPNRSRIEIQLGQKNTNGYKSKPATPNGWRQMDERSPSCSTDTKTRQGGATEAHNGPQIAKRRQTIPKETKRRHGLAMGRHGGPWRAMECQRSAEGHKEAPPQTVGAPWPLGATPRARTRDPQHTHTHNNPPTEARTHHKPERAGQCLPMPQWANRKPRVGRRLAKKWPQDGHRKPRLARLWP